MDTAQGGSRGERLYPTKHHRPEFEPPEIGRKKEVGKQKGVRNLGQEKVPDTFSGPDLEAWTKGQQANGQAVKSHADKFAGKGMDRPGMVKLLATIGAAR